MILYMQKKYVSVDTYACVNKNFFEGSWNASKHEN